MPVCARACQDMTGRRYSLLLLLLLLRLCHPMLGESLVGWQHWLVSTAWQHSFQRKIPACQHGLSRSYFVRRRRNAFAPTASKPASQLVSKPASQQASQPVTKTLVMLTPIFGESVCLYMGEPVLTRKDDAYIFCAFPFAIGIYIKAATCQYTFKKL